MKSCGGCGRSFKPSSRHLLCPACRRQASRDQCGCGLSWAATCSPTRASITSTGSETTTVLRTSSFGCGLSLPGSALPMRWPGPGRSWPAPPRDRRESNPLRRTCVRSVESVKVLLRGHFRLSDSDRRNPVLTRVLCPLVSRSCHARVLQRPSRARLRSVRIGRSASRRCSVAEAAPPGVAVPSRRWHRGLTS